MDEKRAETDRVRIVRQTELFDLALRDAVLYNRVDRETERRPDLCTAENRVSNAPLAQWRPTETHGSTC